MNKGRSRSRAGVYAAIAAIAGTVGLGAVGAAGADGAANADVYAREAGGLCFSIDPAGTCTPSTTGNVAIAPGEAVTWHFDGSAMLHNAASANAVAADPDWEGYAGEFLTTGSYSRQFTQPGIYEYLCQAHPQMKGTITVGDATPTPTPPTPTPTPPAPTPTPTPTQPPSGDGHVATPAPTAGGDTVKPTVRNVSLQIKGRAVRVRFRLSERATVTVRIKRRSRVIKAASVQAAAGTRTVTLRSKRLTKGRYTVEIRARDAYGNRSSLATKRLLVRR
jgi:plastocyanin